MKSILLAASLIMGASFAFAGELDNDSAYTNRQSLQGTVVVRVDTENNSVAYMKTAKVPGSEKEAKAMASNQNFSKLSANNMRSELDQDGGASSWYWYPGYNYGYNYRYSYGYYNSSNLYWYGNTYRPCYNYTYGGYSYYYYSSYSYRWW